MLTSLLPGTPGHLPPMTPYKESQGEPSPNMAGSLALKPAGGAQESWRGLWGREVPSFTFLNTPQHDLQTSPWW